MEAYDDFNGSELNGSNCITAWWSGAQHAFVSSLYLKLFGSGIVHTPESLNPRSADALVKNMTPQPNMHNLLEINATGVYGIEAKVMIPANAPTSPGLALLGFDLIQMDPCIPWVKNLDIGVQGSGLQFGYENEPPPIGDDTETSCYDGSIVNFV